ncbi:MAG: uracil-DNA glycosylase [Acidimicrobiia bacterium]|nr:MAG: uracil-DNA glycosylase [Acidimicrobiia bacterium]
MPVPASRDLRSLALEVSGCRACPRLVAWREQVARERRAAYRGEEYWGRPVPGFGDPRARLLVVGLAPAAHGGNRTGRIFTGDRSGDFLFASLHRTGFANQPTSTARDDGLRLRDAYVAAAVRCAPPANKPTPAERDECRPYLVRELELLRRLRAVVVLGAFAYGATWAALRDHGVPLPARRPRFAHGMEVDAGGLAVLGAFHPSQQNTFTGRLTPAMLDAVFVRARGLVNASGAPG